MKIGEPPLTGSMADLIEEGPHRFRVHGTAYTSQAIFDLEQRQIFEKSWIFAGHESEIRNAGDFKTCHIGTQPVILSRDKDLGIHAMLNRCVHRGATVCREKSGNARGFVCPYHAWSYDIDGTLTGIPLREGPSGYSAEFQAPQGLFRIPRVENYRGFIFISANENAPPLQQFLQGGAAQLIDRKLKQSPKGTITVSGVPFVGVYKGNWKFQSENIVDGYHFMFTHRAFVGLQQKYKDTTGDFGVHKGGDGASDMRKNRLLGGVLGSPEGHGVNQKPVVGYDDFFAGPFVDYYEELQRQHGADELKWILGAGAACIFPNFGMIHNQLRTWRPIGPDLTEVTIYPYTLDGAPDDFNEGMLRSHERFYGPAGYGAVDDVEIFSLNQHGLGANLSNWVLLERGMHSEQRLESGEIEGASSSETVHRAFWRRWKQLMSAKGNEVPN